MLSEICMAKKDHTCIWNPDTELRLTIERSKTEKTKEEELENFSQGYKTAIRSWIFAVLIKHRFHCSYTKLV